MGGIKVGNWKGLRAYLTTALRRCNCELDKDRRDEIELFLIEKFWLAGKNIPTRVGRKRDIGVKWALREKLGDICFQNHTISTQKNEDGEEIDVFEIMGKEESRYAEIEQWHDIIATVGAEPARALLFSLYTEQEQNKKEKTTEKSKQGVLF